MAKKQQIDYNALPDIEEVDYSALPDIEGDSKKKEPTTEVSESLEEPSTSVGTEDVTTQELSFREQKVDTVPDFMGLFKDKEKFKVASKSGVSVSFLNRVNDSAKQAERPLSFLADVRDVTKRLDALPEHFPETKNAAQALKAQLVDVDSRNIDQIKEQVDALESNFRYVRPTQFTQGAGDPRWVDYENKVKNDAATVAIKRLEEDSKELVEVAAIPKGKEVTGIFNKLYTMEKARTIGFGRGIEGYLQGYTEFKDQILQNRAVSELMGKLEQIENGEDVELNEDDRLLLRAVVSNTELHEQLDSEIPRAYKIGEAAGHSLGFMGEFALTGGGKVVGTAVLKGAAKIGAKKAVGKFGVGMAVKLAQAGVHTTKMPMFYQNTALNVSRGMDFGSAILDSYWATTGETLSERIFLGNPVGKRGIGAIDGLMRRMGINFRTDKGALGVFLNVAEETAEEKINEIFQAPKDYNDFKSFWESFTDKEQNLIMIGSVGMTVGTMGAVAITGNFVLETRHRSKVKKLEKFIPSDLRAEIDEILQSKDLSVKDQYSMIGQAISDRIERQELGEDPATTAGNAMLYADYHAKQIASEAANEDAKKEDGEIMTVGKVEPVGEMQTQLDYLKERGVEVSDGATAEDVQVLYEAETAKETEQPQIGEEDFITDNAVMEGIYGNEVEVEGDKVSLPETGFLISDVFLNEGVEKGKGFGQDLYRKALDRFGILYSTYPISEDAIRVQNRLEEKGELTIDFVEVGGVEFRVLRKVDNAKPRVETLEENIVKPRIKEDGKEMQEREGAQQGVQKPEDEVTERGEETADAVEAAGAEAVVPVTSFKKGDGGTKGTFKDKSGKIYKSLVPQRAVFKDGKAVREPIEGATTDEHSILSELQDRSYVPKVGGVVETSEGAAFEIEELSEVDKLSRDEYLQLRANIEQLNSDGYQIGDMVSVMRRPDTGEVVITDFSTAQKGVKDANDVDLLSGVEEKLSPKDRAWVDTRSKAVNARKVAELVGEMSEGNKYLLTQRPPSIGTHPIEGLVGDPVEKQMDGRTVYELSYEKPLSDAEVQKFELSPVLSPSDYVGMIASGVTPGIDFYVKNVKDRTVTLEAVAPNGKTITNNMRTAEFVRKINNNELSLSEPSLKPTTEAGKKAGAEAVNKPIETNKAGTNFYDPTKLEKEEFDVEIDREDVAAPQDRGGGKMFERIRVWSKKKYPNKIIEGGVRNSVDVIKRNDGSVAVEYNNTIVEAKSEQDAIDMATSFLSVLDRDASAQFIKPTTAPQKPSDRVSPEKGVTTPQKEKVGEKAFKLFENEGEWAVVSESTKQSRAVANFVYPYLDAKAKREYNKLRNETDGVYGTKKEAEDRLAKLSEFENKHKDAFDKARKDAEIEGDRITPPKPKKQAVKSTESGVPTLEEKKITRATGIKPKNVRDVYKAGREVFGLNRAQALAQAVVVDRIIGKIAKRRGVSKDKVYADVEFRKGLTKEGVKAPQGAKGAISIMSDGRAVISALTDPNVSTPLHEVAHLYERYMSKAERDAVLKWAKHKEWTTETSEKFARGFERYLAEGKAPNTALQKVFDRFKAWLTDIYNGITGSEIDLELNDGMRAVYSSMLGEGVVRAKSTPKVEYKQKFDDVDDLLFQGGRDVFYSPTERALENIKQEKGTPEQMKAMLLKNGAKQAELDYMGFDEAFTGKSVTKAEIQQWIDGNKVEIEEVEKREGEKRNLEIVQSGESRWLYDVVDENGVKYLEGVSQSRADQYVDNYWDGRGNTKYSQYQLPGATNYREVLLTMPKKETPDYKKYKEYVKTLVEKYGYKYNENNTVAANWLSVDEKVTREEAQKYFEYLDKNDKESRNSFQSSHWEEANILAHVRLNERTDKEGRRLLHLEEIQSDWAQKGKKEGFKKSKKYYDDLQDKLTAKRKEYDQLPPEKMWGDYGNKLQEEIDELSIDLAGRSMASVPDMPFKQTPQWVNLVLRRMAVYAAENGYDGISWTPGEQQAERYDLSKQVDEIVHNKLKNGKTRIIVRKNNEDAAIHDVAESELETYVGKDVAEKIINGEGEVVAGGGKSLSGLDLKVGGTGMLEFYDKIVPNQANKIFKKFGAKVGVTEIEQGEQDALKVNYIPITPKLSQTALSEGMPLFQGEDKTQRHTQAVNNLVSNFEKEGVADMDKAVRDYLSERGNPVSEDIINNVLKQRGYAEEIGKVRQESEGAKQKQEGEPVGGVREGDRAKAVPEEKKIEQEVDAKRRSVGEQRQKGGVRESRAGIRYAFGENFSQAGKQAYRDGKLYEYTPESHDEVAALAQSIFDLNDIATVEKAFRNERIPRRVRVGIGALLALHYEQVSDKYAEVGQNEIADQYINLEMDIMKSIQDDMSIEIGRDMAFFNSAFYSGMLTPYSTARKVQLAYEQQRDNVEKSKPYKRTVKKVEKDLYDLRKKVVEEVNKKPEVQKAKRKYTKKTVDSFKERIRKERSSLIDELKRRRKQETSMAVIPFLTNADIEIGTKIALTYIKEGIYDAKILIKHLKESFKEAGLDIGDAEAEKMIPNEIDGKSLGDLQKEKAKEQAAAKLASSEFGLVVDKKAPKDDPMQQMVNTLIAKFRERAKEGDKPAPKKNIDVIKEAILNKKDYMDVWKEARDVAIKKIQENEDLTDEQKIKYADRINGAYEKATKFSVSEKRVQQLIRESLKDRELSLDDIVRDHYDRRELYKQDLITDLVEKAGLTGQEAQELADVIDHAFNTLMTEKGASLLNRYVKGKSKEKKARGVRSEVARIIELSNIGAFDSQEFRDLFADEYGIPKFDKKDRDEIIRRAKLIQKIKGADRKHKEEQKLYSYIISLRDIDWGEVAAGFWYSHVLSGVSTQLKNSLDASISSMIETMVLAGFSRTDARIAVNGYFRGFRGEGYTRMMESLKEGYSTLHKKIEVEPVLERVDVKPAHSTVPAKQIGQAFQAYIKMLRAIPRIMQANDNLFYSATKGAVSALAVSREERMNVRILKGRRLTRQERENLQNQINRRLSVTKEQVSRLQDQVEQESEELKEEQSTLGFEPTGYTQREKNLRLYELMDQEVGVDITSRAYDMAGRITGNIRMYGTLGMLVEGLGRPLNEAQWDIPVMQWVGQGTKRKLKQHPTETMTIRPFKFLMPFTTIVANVATRDLGYNPLIGTVRGINKRFGWITGKDSRYRVDFTQEEQQARWRKVAIVGGIHALLYAYMSATMDDDDPWFEVTLKGAFDYRKNKQLEETGWRRSSIRFGNKSFDYRWYGPLAAIMMPLGYVNDMKRYMKSEKSDLQLYAEGVLLSVPLILEATPISSLIRVADALKWIMTGEPDQAGKKLAEISGGIATGFVSPNALRDIESTYDVLAKNPYERGETFFSRLVQYIPFVGGGFTQGRLMIDTFGNPKPTKVTTAKFIENVSKDELVNYYIDQGYFRPAIEMSQTTFTVYDKSMTPVRIKPRGDLKEDVALMNMYEMVLGAKFKEEVRVLKEMGYKDERFVKEMESRWRAIQDESKAEIFNYTMDRPVATREDADPLYGIP